MMDDGERQRMAPPAVVSFPITNPHPSSSFPFRSLTRSPHARKATLR